MDLSYIFAYFVGKSIENISACRQKMKRILLSIALATAVAAAPGAAAAAEPASNNAATETFYIQLVSRSRFSADRGDNFASIETGREFVQLTGMSEGLAARIGKRRFPSLLDGLNKLAINGWRLVDASTVTQGATSTVTWTLAKTVGDRSELLDGLTD
ncbi:MAG: hypothetical protein K2K97_10095 [Muribaculaceae bacterium]|nr:hypothetical protein [Muribaculaceae bacterium]